MAAGIGFIGGGNMAASLIGGLLQAGVVTGDEITVADPDAEKRSALARRFGVTVTGDGAEVAEAVGTVVLAVKPQVMHSAVSALAKAWRRGQPLMLSVAAGVREPDLRGWLDPHAAIVRCMPNTPALLGCGAIGLYANDNVTPAQRESAQQIMRAVGITEWVDNEPLLDVVTALSGSGPAYYFAMMEWMIAAARELGMDEGMATRLTVRTALGAARMADEGGESPARLRGNVTSPGGTTESALAAFADGGAPELVRRALGAARDRAIELGDEFGLGV